MPLYSDEALFASLSELSIIPKDALAEASGLAVRTKTDLGSVLLEKDLISDEHLGRIVAELMGMKFVVVCNISIPKEVLFLIPELFAKKNKAISFRLDKEGLHVATSNPKDLQMVEFIEKKVGIPIILYYAADRDITTALNAYTKDIKGVFSEIIQASIVTSKDPTRSDGQIIQIVDTILYYAYQNKASDIHVEPQKEWSLVRFRVDGILHDVVKLPMNIHAQIITRVKVLSRLRTDEHQAPQDGKLQFKAEGEDVDVRVSIVPITEGEKIVMRLLSGASRRISLKDLGFYEKDLELVHSAYHKPYGMILSTGPTGSGKTTTMYAILKMLNSRDVNIMTIEDPVEYELEGVNQIQVNPKTNLTFAEGLRSILRQDPNILLVGEIRDKETAAIAVNAAMTGHLVLSTLHTNDSATAIPRLMDMGVEPFLIASSVNVIIAQRLVRKIHLPCRISVDVDAGRVTAYLGSERTHTLLGTAKTILLYEGKGCALCHNTGYDGRIGIYEVLVITDEIRNAIVARKDASVIAAIAKSRGMRMMLDEGVEKLKEGITTLDEIIRVTKS